MTLIIRTTLLVGVVEDLEVVVINSMSFPMRILEINSKTEDFPTLVSLTRMMVYGLFALFLDVLMTPFLGDSMSL